MKSPISSSTQAAAVFAALFALAVMPLTARANSITENFTVTINPAATLTRGANGFYATSPVPEFNPANGTLTSVDGTLTGSGTWTSTASPQNGLSPGFGVEFVGAFQSSSHPPDLTVPGRVTLNLSGALESVYLSFITGTGTVTPGFFLYDLNSTGTDTFQTVGSLSGTITYNYTPTASAAEPGALTLSLLAVGAIALYEYRRRLVAQPR